MADPFAEIDDDLRAERLRLAFRRSLPAIVLGLVVIVGAVGVWQWTASRRVARDASLSAAFFDAQRNADETGANAATARATAINQFATLARTGTPGMRTLARLREAQLLGDKGDATGAVHSLDAVAADAKAPAPFRELATLLSVDRSLAAENERARRDPATGRALANRLATLERAGGPFRPLALETDAMIALGRGDRDATRRTLSLLVDDGSASQGLRERAGTMLEALGAATGAGG